MAKGTETGLTDKPLDLRPTSSSPVSVSNRPLNPSRLVPEDSQRGVLPIINIIKSWLSSKSPQILSFWTNATWSGWARVELFMAFEKALSSSCLVLHDLDDDACGFSDNDDHDVDYTHDFKSKDAEGVDILISPRDGQSRTVLLRLRCERVGENEGSFERFVAEMKRDWARLKSKATASTAGQEGENSEWGETKIMLVGFSGEGSVDEFLDGDGHDEAESEHDTAVDTATTTTSTSTGPISDYWVDGHVYTWIMEWDVPNSEK